jgi:GT2 family glycosyltransferase
MSVNSKPNATVAGLESLKEYVEAKNFSWKCVQGNKPTTFRAIPRRSDTPKVQVIIPYKDQRDLTVKSVESLLGQTGAILHITCVDNNSNDPKIARFLEDMDTKITVLKYTEPFNYSRINNYAVRKGGDGEPYLFFMNNDVKLRPGALQEMLRWIDQPHIGIVSCRLFYPDKKIQHGGIMLWTEGPEFRCIWKHVDYELMKDQATFSDNLMIVDAVTAACALMRRKDFDGIGGFDECHYPVAFSDTDLCMRLRHKGLYPFFTPFAEGIHYEGASRDNDNLEDLESSLFFNRELRFDIDLRRLVPYYSMGNF